MRETRTIGVEKTRPYISAVYLLADKPTGYTIPEGFKITICPTKVAHGARRQKGNAMLGSTCPRRVWK